jgi:hypothetical protein
MLGANGGFGWLGDYTLTLLTGSDDVTQRTVSLNPDRLLDIGHVDIYTAGVARQEFWQPVLEWIEAHAAKDAATRNVAARE